MGMIVVMQRKGDSSWTNPSTFCVGKERVAYLSCAKLLWLLIACPSTFGGVYRTT